jgi:cobalt transporter subunit CbtA
VLYRIFFVGLVAGCLAALAMAAVQQVKIIPLITAAEVYESATEPHGAAMEHGMAAHAPEWEPKAGFQRVSLTFLADLILAIGFGLALSGSFAIRQAFSGHVPDAREGLLWGIAGFAAFALAPALGLPPEPPGMISADIYARQGWWLGTAFATCAGLGLTVFARARIWRIAGLVLLVVPHLIGAPARPPGNDAVTATIAAHFVAASLVTAAVFWAVLGLAAGWLYAAMEKQRLAAAPSRAAT